MNLPVTDEIVDKMIHRIESTIVALNLHSITFNMSSLLMSNCRADIECWIRILRIRSIYNMKHLIFDCQRYCRVPRPKEERTVLCNSCSETYRNDFMIPETVVDLRHVAKVINAATNENVISVVDRIEEGMLVYLQNIKVERASDVVDEMFRRASQSNLSDVNEEIIEISMNDAVGSQALSNDIKDKYKKLIAWGHKKGILKSVLPLIVFCNRGKIDNLQKELLDELLPTLISLIEIYKNCGASGVEGHMALNKLKGKLGVKLGAFKGILGQILGIIAESWVNIMDHDSIETVREIWTPETKKKTLMSSSVS
jgi:hypothetical protein